MATLSQGGWCGSWGRLGKHRGPSPGRQVGWNAMVSLRRRSGPPPKMRPCVARVLGSDNSRQSQQHGPRYVGHASARRQGRLRPRVPCPFVSVALLPCWGRALGLPRRSGNACASIVNVDTCTQTGLGDTVTGSMVILLLQLSSRPGQSHVRSLAKFPCLTSARGFTRRPSTRPCQPTSQWQPSAAPPFLR